jgi:hypothetical protein
LALSGTKSNNNNNNNNNRLPLQLLSEELRKQAPRKINCKGNENGQAR